MSNEKPILIFDLGKVLVDFDYSIAAQKISARSVNPPELHQFFHNLGPLLEQFETGLITRQEFFEVIREAVGFQGSPAEFGEYFAKIFAPITPMIELHAALRGLGYRTYLFSNTNDLAIEHIRKDYPFFQHFDGYILSYEIKAMKPNPPIYEAMELMCGHRGADLLYIDDLPENVAAGAKRGWRTILHETPEKTRAQLGKWGVII
jgi:HAD superfamily hydrolase (TIGR01509 family)